MFPRVSLLAKFSVIRIEQQINCHQNDLFSSNLVTCSTPKGSHTLQQRLAIRSSEIEGLIELYSNLVMGMEETASASQTPVVSAMCNVNP